MATVMESAALRTAAPGVPRFPPWFASLRPVDSVGSMLHAQMMSALADMVNDVHVAHVEARLRAGCIQRAVSSTAAFHPWVNNHGASACEARSVIGCRSPVIRCRCRRCRPFQHADRKPSECGRHAHGWWSCVVPATATSECALLPGGNMVDTDGFAHRPRLAHRRGQVHAKPGARR